MQKPGEKLIQRERCLEKLEAFRDLEPVKIVTGIRRCGKSTLLRLMMEQLRAEGVAEEQILAMNFESIRFRGMTAEAVYRYVAERLPQGKRAYLFLDELQRVDAWQDAVNSLRVDFDCDIYVTGSNAYLLSSEYATYLAGRFVEIKMYPLSFREFLDFQSFKISETAAGRRFETAEGAVCTADEALALYLRFGGMPGLADTGLDTEKAFALLDGIYATVVMRDILERERRRGERRLTDPELLRKILLFLADNVGSNVSASAIAGTLKHERLLEGGKAPAVQTVQAYIAALCEAYVFYPVKRFDIKGKEFLRTLGKYYIADTGLRNFLLGFRERDSGHVLENVVYFELLRRGYDVAVGKYEDKEIDFVAIKGDEKIYYQVTETLADEAVREREFVPLEKIPDNFEKTVLIRYGDPGRLANGLRVVRVTDFLLEEDA